MRVVDVQNRNEMRERGFCSLLVFQGNWANVTAYLFLLLVHRFRLPHYRILGSWRTIVIYVILSCPPTQLRDPPQNTSNFWPLQHLWKCGAQFFTLKYSFPWPAWDTSMHHSIFKSGAQFLWGPVIGLLSVDFEVRKTIQSCLSSQHLLCDFSQLISPLWGFLTCKMGFTEW